MTTDETTGLDALDVLFGYGYVMIGEQRYKRRVLLTRRQSRVVNTAVRGMGEIQRRVSEILKDATSTETAVDIEKIVTQAEQLEDDGAALIVAALDALVINMPTEWNELSFASVCAIFGVLQRSHAESSTEHVRVLTAHPTVASNGS